MPQCKRNFCKNEALPHGPRLCAEHAADHKRRHQAHMALPECSVSGCKQRTRNGVCPSCQKEIDARSEKDAVLRELQSCETISELRAFIKRHLYRA